jgi:light-regulated signal transduction histidine kinase (bacteriophytochrome)
VAHHIKSPLNNISSLTEILLYQYLEIFDEQGKMMMQMLGISAQVLREPVDWILEHGKRDHL